MIAEIKLHTEATNYKIITDMIKKKNIEFLTGLENEAFKALTWRNGPML